ncbi:putative defense protein 3 [Eurytemora carolleeae]|uniref:putative defense protein 3 n=1 Tax=Eurytemora carolleeae TaxID=1294199 RepID=UPI000C7647B2|nr:putative defense protein 3 [Eurytemora carolleeae]|eukprot:XP_023326948.1 putative defense protein 3 [Eurytemora affinis]
MNVKLLTAGLLILAINTVSGYPNGAPASQCSSMVPGHGVSSLDILKSPYTIKVGKADISSSEKLEIEILASEETEAFTGKYFIFLKPILSFLNFFTDLSEIHSHKKDKLISEP